MGRHVRTPVPTRNCKSSISGRAPVLGSLELTLLAAAGGQQYTLLYPSLRVSDQRIIYWIATHAQQSQADATQLESLTFAS